MKGYYTCLAEHMDRMVLNGVLVQENLGMVLTDAQPAGLLSLDKQVRESGMMVMCQTKVRP